MNQASAAHQEFDIYEVQLGDTLGKIADHFYGDRGLYEVILDANRDQLDNPDDIIEGMKLRISRRPPENERE